MFERQEAEQDTKTGGDAAVGNGSATGAALQGAVSGASDRSAHGAVPEFFHQIAATVDGKLRCLIVLEAAWTDDGSIDEPWNDVEEKWRGCRPLSR